MTPMTAAIASSVVAPAITISHRTFATMRAAAGSRGASSSAESLLMALQGRSETLVIAGATTLLAIAAVIGVIGYRVFKAEGSAPAEVTALLPKGARVIAAAVAEDRIAVTLDVGGAIEIRTFDVKTLKPTGRLRFATEP